MLSIHKHEFIIFFFIVSIFLSFSVSLFLDHFRCNSTHFLLVFLFFFFLSTSLPFVGCMQIQHDACPPPILHLLNHFFLSIFIIILRIPFEMDWILNISSKNQWKRRYDDLNDANSFISICFILFFLFWTHYIDRRW